VSGSKWWGGFIRRFNPASGESGRLRRLQCEFAGGFIQPRCRISVSDQELAGFAAEALSRRCGIRAFGARSTFPKPHGPV
jgi:hypothetical protein